MDKKEQEVKVMRVYIVNVSANTKENKIIEEFNNCLLKELSKYTVEHVEVNYSNYAMILARMRKEDLVVIYNIADIKKCKRDGLDRFIDKVKRNDIEIWPIAIDRENRAPIGEFVDKQSFDVWEQLRSRNLDEEYVSVVAKILSRKIISKVFPTLYCESGEIFLSHRRVDGEEITAKIYDKMIVMAKEITAFRDVVNVKVGEEAQNVIDKHMGTSDVFVFIHTPKSGKSPWIQKELRYALLRNIPILWVKIDDANVKALRVRPSDEPHLSFKSEDFGDDKKLVEIVDEILNKSFELVMRHSNKTLEYSEKIMEEFGENVNVHNMQELVYHVSIERKGYYYPQRNIEQFYQIYGRTPNINDAKRLNDILKKEERDSVVVLTNRIVSRENKENIVFDSFENFYSYWRRYLYNTDIQEKNMEIVISGAFPDADEIYKQSLVDALIHFSKVIFRRGYKLTFGAHPTFQELFFETAKEENPKDYKQRLNMYISDWFLNGDMQKMDEYKENCTLHVSNKKDDALQSLTQLRKDMIQRMEVKALVCLGGKIKTNKLEEGIREEIELARKMNIPVFVVGTVGGCSSKVASEYKKRGWNLINDAPKQLNEQFHKDIDYFAMAHKMIDFLN